MNQKSKASHPTCKPGFRWSPSQRRCIRSRSKDAASSLVRRKLPSAIIGKLKKLSESGMGFQLVVLIMKNGKHLSHIKVLNGSIALVPQGLNINQVINVRLAKGKKTNNKAEPTAFGIMMSRDSAASILGMGSGILHWQSSTGIEPLKKECQDKPAYLIAKDKDGKSMILGIIKASRLESHKSRIKVLRKFSKEKAVKILGNPNTHGPTIKRELIHFLDDKKTGAPEESKSDDTAVGKILANTVGDPVADAGAHKHPRLVRTEGRVFAGDSGHFHKVVTDDGRIHVTDIDGDHPHGLDGDLATEEGSEHNHTLGLPEDLGGGFVKTDMGTPHTHPALTQSTGFGGPHTHKVVIDGKTYTTLTAEEEAMIMPGGLGDSPGIGPSSPGMIIGIAEDLGIKTDGSIENAIEEILKHTSPQEVVLSKQRFKSLEDAKIWIKDNGFSDKKLQETSNTFVFTQFADGKCKKGTLKTIRPKGSVGVSLVLCMTKKDEPEDPKAEKQVVQESSIRIHKTTLGFTSFIRRGDKIFGMDQKATGKAAGTVTLLEMQRMDGDAMTDAPPGAKEAILIEEVDGDPKKLAKDNLGRRVFVMKKVGDRLVERDIFLAVIDPTKAEKEGCGCGGKGGA